MSDQSQGPGWWLASDGKWYPPQPETPAEPPTDPGYAPTQTDVPSVPPAAPAAAAAAWGTPADQAPTAAYTPDQYPPTQPPPGQYPPGQVPPGGAPPPGTVPPASGGGSKGLIIGLVVLVVLLLFGGVAFALTRNKDTTDTTATTVTVTTLKIPDLTSTTKKDDTTTSSRETTTTKKAGTTTTTAKAGTTTTAKATTTTATSDSTTPVGPVGDIAAYCASFKKISDDDPLAGVDKSDNQAKQIAIGTYIAKHAQDLATMAGNAPAAIQPDITKFVTLLSGAVADPTVLDGDEFTTTAKNITTYNSANC